MIEVSAIVPVFNEEKTVGKVVETLLASPIVDEVVCVDDGSKDKSRAVLTESFGERIRLITFRQNRGKGAALAAGVEAAQGKIVAFFDADLVTLNDTHINSLISPLLEGRARATLGYHPVTYSDRLVNCLTGERAFFKEDLLPHLAEMKKTRFGVEIFLNSQFKDAVEVLLHGLRGTPKFEKFSPSEAISQLLKEAVEVAQAIGKEEKAKLQDLKIIRAAPRIRIKDSPAKLKDQLLAFQEKISQVKSKRTKEFLDRYLNRVIEALQEWFS